MKIMRFITEDETIAWGTGWDGETASRLEGDVFVNLTDTGDRANDYVEHARYGARQGLLPWSRERRIGQILINARRLADDGQTEKALILCCIRLSTTSLFNSSIA